MKLTSVKPKMPKIPARSVSAGGGVTPSSSTAISRIKQIGKNPDAVPQVKIADAIHKYYEKTIDDIDRTDRLNLAKNLAYATGVATTMGAGSAAFKGNTSLRNAFIATSGLAGLLGGMAQKRKKNIQYRMKQRHKGIAKGFMKQAVLGGLGHAAVEGGKALVHGGAMPVAPLVVSAVDILSLPYAGKKGTELLRKGISRSLKGRLGMPMTAGERVMEGVQGTVSGSRESLRNMVEKAVGAMGGGEKAKRIASGIADYPGQVAGALTGEGGSQVAEKIEPVMDVLNQIDPLMTQRIVHAIPAGKEGDAARAALAGIGKKYDTHLKRVSKAFNDTKVLKGMVNSKPGSKEKFMSDLKGMYDANLHHTKIEGSADKVIDMIKDFDNAAHKAKKYHSKNEKLFNVMGTILRKGSPAKPIEEVIRNQSAEQLVDNIIKGIEKGKDASRGLAFGAAALGIGAGSGYAAEKAKDKVKSSKISAQTIAQKLKSA